MSDVLRLIEAVAPDYRATAEELEGERALFTLQLTLADGTVLGYRLEVKVRGKSASVREVEPRHLPGFCPQRHINVDGTFCLYWTGAGSLDVTTADEARAWWETVWKYLTLQSRAEKKRRWPNNEEWAHGNAAAHQKNAIDAAARLGGKFSDALAAQAITIQVQPKRRTAQGPTLQVSVRGRYLYSVWLNSGKVVNRKQRCFCGASGKKTPLRLRACKRHAEDAADLALELKRWQEAEALFWQTFQGKRCCGTCDSCPLQVNQGETSK